MGLVGLTLALSLAGSWHYIFFTFVLMLGPFVYLLLPSIRQQWRGWVVPITTAVFTATLIIGPFLLMAFQARSTLNITSGLTYANINATSVSLERFIVPSGINPQNWTLAHNAPNANHVSGIAPHLFCKSHFHAWHHAQSQQSAGHARALLHTSLHSNQFS